MGIAKFLRNILIGEEEDKLCAFISHERATIGWELEEEKEPLLDSDFGANKRVKISTVEGDGSQYVDIKQDAVHIKLPIYENGMRKRGKYLHLFLHDWFGQHFGVTKDGKFILPEDIQLKLTNLERESKRLNALNLDLLSDVMTVSNQDRFGISEEQRANRAELLRKKYAPFIPMQGGDQRK